MDRGYRVEVKDLGMGGQTEVSRWAQCDNIVKLDVGWRSESPERRQSPTGGTLKEL